jgi:hypothetical protein
MIGDLRVMAVGNSTSLLKQKSGQTLPLGISQGFGNFLPWPPHKLWLWNFPLMNSAFCWLLIRSIPMHGLEARDFWSQDKVLKTSYIDWSDRRMVRFRDIRCVKPQPTHTHISDTHSHSYGHFGTATGWVCGLPEIGFTDELKLLTWLWTAPRSWLLTYY